MPFEGLPLPQLKSMFGSIWVIVGVAVLKMPELE
jgi:hypothetical protein